MNILLLWHMHQPDYIDHSTNVALMPWVRLHSVHSYLDMLEMVERFPGLKTIFNFTPVLLEQIEKLVQKEAKDFVEILTRIPATELTPIQKQKILENFFKANYETMIRPIPRYYELLQRRGKVVNYARLEELTSLFSPQDYLDIQVFYNLVWCGYAARKQYPFLNELRKQGGNYTEEQKEELLKIHHSILSSIIPKYKMALDRGQIEITTSPFYHPILPLIYDTNFARRCMPYVNLPSQFKAPEDALNQLKLGQEKMKSVFGRPARGLWPSEGSVCPELLPLFKEAGFDYFFTDESILFRSLELDPHWRGKHEDHLLLFQGWRVELPEASLCALFRERPLSDFIGFKASQNDPGQAANFLLHSLENTCKHIDPKRGAVLIALDGENAWESFNDGGEAFLSSFYRGLVEHRNLKTTLASEYFDTYPPANTVYKLYTGSWINADFDIWIGDSEENKAWEWLGKTREFLTKNSNKEGNASELKSWKCLYAAEGSDWFWWYGPDFSTDSDQLFDELFRSHLKNVYGFLGFTPPPYLDLPINVPSLPVPYIFPRLYISPKLTGRLENYFDWVGAGFLDISVQQTAMYQSNRIGKKLFFGFDKNNFYLRLDLATKPEIVVVDFISPAIHRVECVAKDSNLWDKKIEAMDSAGIFQPVGGTIEVFWDDFFVLALPVAAIGWKENSQVSFFVRILNHEHLSLERYPERGTIDFLFPSEDFELQQWFI
ncbi:alpha-amlyase [Candidatus Methylacidiphilum fumarolicum]|uniref:Alpha-amylase/alpha-mannosidase n=2 Tax=Candidatus Methylacidiphilum fumarolicum TaxID=591154 RepID=I0JZ38_METFB|nr:glycoside hydrolase family 57 protein [Candidatus Methylacidiphilum fumarolicum]MBW6414664.1 alpha-amylase [Candidatus Methylacidiphilum fumarolicum]TFE65681.1 alpha-amlyase [Candidatus Methylacidiphilum fumarolicum]TFE74234.1 alpha-amlyase [Candidatus Methylacidiphilum fumarolicum]TFE75733.1 alpha-amlyase [Candidatus Methylacidiphilum fumarolicum]TFE75893.1 alpha-amlyase [Candidatus Methylacidiphilum fumarolicum]